MERIASDLSGRDVGVIGLPAVLLAAGLSGAAWGLTKLRCGGGQGADVFGIGWTRSTYCRALHLPGFPASAASVLFTVGLFLFPVVVTSIGLFIAYRTGASGVLGRAMRAAGAVIVVSFVLVIFASASYRGP